MAKGFGVAGALDCEIIARLAPEAERAGFSTFWANDTPNGDGLEALAVAIAETDTIRLGVGVIPIDRKPARAIAEQVKRLGLPKDRLTIGIGAGGMRSGSLGAVRAAAIELKDQVAARILIGALGPRMTELGGEVADGALLNWLTTDEAAASSKRVRTAASAAGRPVPHVAGYVRVALGDPAYDKLAQEAARYERFPQYGRHFDKMGVSAIETAIFGIEPEALQTRLAGYEDKLDEVVVRAICAEDTLEDYLALLYATAPRK